MWGSNIAGRASVVSAVAHCRGLDDSRAHARLKLSLPPSQGAYPNQSAVNLAGPAGYPLPRGVSSRLVILNASADTKIRERTIACQDGTVQ